MRATCLFLAAAIACVSAGVLLGADKEKGTSKGASKADKDSQRELADRIYGNADKNKDSSLDEKELLQAKHIFKSAFLQGKKAEELPGGAKTLERIQGAATGGTLNGKSGAVSKDAWFGHVKDAFGEKQEIVQDAREKMQQAIEAQKAAYERQRQEAAKRQTHKQQQERRDGKKK